MKSDPIDELSERLFEAARREPLPERGLERALLAAREARKTAEKAGLPRRWPAAFGLAAAALVAGAAWFVEHRGEEVSRISAEPAPSVQLDRAPQPPSSASKLTNVAPSTSVVAPRAASALPSSATPAHSAPTVMSLSDELTTLNAASSALRSGDTRAALAALDHYDHAKGQKMRAEATLIRIEALSRSGQTDAASQLAAQFVEKNPESPLVDRARTFVKTTEK